MYTLHGDQYTFLIFHSSLLRMRYVSDRICKENQNTYFIFSNFFLKNRYIFDIMWKNVVELVRPLIAIWRMCIVCWITKATNILSGYVLPTAFPLQQWLLELISLLCCKYFACLVENYWKCQHIISVYLLYLEVIYKRRPGVIFRENR